MNKRTKSDRQWQEVEEFRDLLQAPGRYEEGFTLRTIIGVFFISIIMTPGEMYLGLVTGGGIGSAAQWVTVILFLEVAKRSFTSLKRYEIYLLVYVAGALIARQEGAFFGLLWRQYFVGSQEARLFGLSKILPWWWCPQADSPAIINRTFLHKDWLIPILLLMVGTLFGRITWFTSGYTLFRVTSDYERLPFPTAPMSALSSMALAEESGSERETWKWQMFSIGGAIGAAFGAIYVGVPSLSGVLLNKTIQIIPIPFVDFTPYTGNILPATSLGITFNLGLIFGGLMAPFWSIMGTFLGVILHVVCSPILHHYGFMTRWAPGMDTIQTNMVTGIDFWRAFGIGITLAVTVISFYQIATASKRYRDEREAAKRLHGRGLPPPPPGRGDFPIKICMILFGLGALYPIVLAKILFPRLIGPGFLLIFFLIGFVYAPLISFVSARMDGLIGRNVSIPYIHEAVIYLSGYRGVDIWFVPFPGQNFGGNAEQFRIVELTGMKFTSLLKAELFMIPVVFCFSLMYWSFLWKLAPIPSESYPYAQRMWPLQAFNQAVYLSSTMYSRMWHPGDRVGGVTIPEGQVAWSPSNLLNRSWWYWRVRATDEKQVQNPLMRAYGEWSAAGVFYTDFDHEGPPEKPPMPILPWEEYEEERRTGDNRLPETPELVTPRDGQAIHTPTPNLTILIPKDPEGDPIDYYFEVDQRPTFDGEFFQRSSDRPILFEALWHDATKTGDGKDNDGDGRIDEEFVNQKDDDGDNLIDEDTRHPLNGRKWPIILSGLGFALFFYFALSFFGLPIFMIWGYVGSITGIPHNLIVGVIGAFLARFYFWKRYGRQQWRLYAMVMSVGFGVGMSLIGLFCVAFAMIQKSVSTLMY